MTLTGRFRRTLIAAALLGLVCAPLTSSAAYVVINGNVVIDCADLNTSQTCEGMCGQLNLNPNVSCEYHPAGPGGGDYLTITFLTIIEELQIETEAGTVIFGEGEEEAYLEFAMQPNLIGFRTTTAGVVLTATAGIVLRTTTEADLPLGTWESPFDIELAATDGLRIAISSSGTNTVLFEDRGAIVPTMNLLGTALLLGFFTTAGYASLRLQRAKAAR